VQSADTDDLPADPGRSDQELARRRSRFLLPAYVLLIAYVSLSPLAGWRAPEHGVLAFLRAWPHHWTVFDVAANVLAYLPLGMLGYGAAQRRFGATVSLLAASLAGFAVSLAMESVQTALPGRVASPLDLLANSFGTLLGALFAARVGESTLARWLADWRRDSFREGPGVEFGELLTLVWLFVQLNPSIPFFSAGNIVDTLTAAWDETYSAPWFALPQTIAVALNVAGFGLFASTLLRPRVRPMPLVLGLLASGLALKLMAAGVLLKRPLMLEWLSGETLAGLAVGIAVIWPLARRGLRARSYAAAMLILAGGVLAKLAAIYDGFPAILALFAWSYGQLFNFASLTLFLNEFWPLAALACLFVMFVRAPRGPADSAAV